MQHSVSIAYYSQLIKKLMNKHYNEKKNQQILLQKQELAKSPWVVPDGGKGSMTGPFFHGKEVSARMITKLPSTH